MYINKQIEDQEPATPVAPTTHQATPATPPVTLTKPTKDVTPEYTKNLTTIQKETQSATTQGWEKHFEQLQKESPPLVATVGRKPENNLYNRYKNIYPADKDRVILPSDTTLDQKNPDRYINATYIDEKAYIATQGPLLNTIDHYWEMVWADNVNTVSVLTNLVEGDKIKSAQFWPENLTTPIQTREHIITMTNEINKDTYMVRTLTLTNRQTGETKEVTLFQFTDWPTSGLPQPQSFLDYRQAVNNHQKANPGAPLCLSCSGGIGRSGTYIVFDKLVREIESGKSMKSIFDTIKDFRSSRGLVQTKGQLAFIHNALSLYLTQKIESEKEDGQVTPMLVEKPTTKKPLHRSRSKNTKEKIAQYEALFANKALIYKKGVIYTDPNLASIGETMLLNIPDEGLVAVPFITDLKNMKIPIFNKVLSAYEQERANLRNKYIKTTTQSNPTANSGDYNEFLADLASQYPDSSTKPTNIYQARAWLAALANLTVEELDTLANDELPELFGTIVQDMEDIPVKELNILLQSAGLAQADANQDKNTTQKLLNERKKLLQDLVKYAKDIIENKSGRTATTTFSQVYAQLDKTMEKQTVDKFFEAKAAQISA